MWVVATFSFVLLAISIALNIVVIKQNMMLHDQRELLVDTIEQSLDALDESYGEIARLAQVPVLSDEPLIRDLYGAMARAKHAVLAIASHIVVYGHDPEDDEEGT